jgi:hypothetical protein
MKRFYILVLAVLFVGASVSAQETATESVDTRLSKIEKRTAILEKLSQYIKVTGFIQGEYDWLDDRDGKSSTGTSSFYIRRARISLAGDLYKGKKGARLDYRLYVDIARIPKNPILDLWVRYQPCKEFGVQFGQFKNPVTFEAGISPNQYDFIDFSYAVSNLAKMGANDLIGVNKTARDAGFQLFGGFVHRDGYSIINYNIGVLNGNGMNEKDNNKSKDIFARLTFKPTKNLAIATYYQWGEANLTSFSAEKYAEYGWSGNTEYVPMHRWGGGFEYNSDKAFARGEYIAGLTGSLASEGVYVQGGKKFNLPKNAGMLWAGGMVDYFCRNCFDYINRDTKRAAIDMRYSVCVGYRPVKYFHLQLAYSLEHRLNHNPDYTPNCCNWSGKRPFGNGIKLMLTASF